MTQWRREAALINQGLLLLLLRLQCTTQCSWSGLGRSYRRRLAVGLYERRRKGIGSRQRWMGRRGVGSVAGHGSD